MKLKKSAAAMMLATLATGSFISVASAQADPNTYLAVLSSNGVTVLNPNRAIADGYKVCAAQSQGVPKYLVVQAMMQDNPTLSYSGAVFEVDTAANYLC